MSAIGFIGTGNMATAIASGIKISKIFCYDISKEKSQIFADKFSAGICGSISDICKLCKYIFIAVKPQNIDDVLPEIKSSSKPDNVYVSIVAGLSSDYIVNCIGEGTKVIPVMPNTPLMIGEGAVAVSKTESVSEDEFEVVCNIFSANGAVAPIDEDKMKEIIAVNGSSPAFIYLFAKGFIDYGKSVGIDEKVVTELFCQSLIGSAKMITDSGYSVDELIKMVSSPGGTTLKGLEAFYEANLLETIKAACEKCVKRAYELSK